MPKRIRENLEIIIESEQYSRLIQCIAEWFSLMELCEDLIERVKLYGISAYMDEKAIIEKLHRNWVVKENEDVTLETTMI